MRRVLVTGLRRFSTESNPRIKPLPPGFRVAQAIKLEQELEYEEVIPTPESFLEHKNELTGELGGPKGPEPTRFGDWERAGRISDF